LHVSPRIFEICSLVEASGLQVESQLSVIVTIDPDSEESMPSCHLPGEWLFRLGKIRAEVDVDIY
jgi:hypothetical protein